MGREDLPVQNWHTRAVSEIEQHFMTSSSGLTAHEAGKRLHDYGPNLLPHKQPPSWWSFYVRQFKSPLIYILGIAAAVSAAIGEIVDAGFIGIVLLLNALIGGYQEWRAEKQSLALQKLLKIKATVRRDGISKEIEAEHLVPGDIILLESGNRVGADIRIMQSRALEIDESLLTGESLSVAKDASWRGSDSTALADRKNMAYAGSVVVRGRAEGIVVHTGSATVVGQLAVTMASTVGGKPPLLLRMERFSRLVAWVVLGASVLVAAIGVVLHGHHLTDMFMFGVALAVSAIPEGLPVALTVALAVATNRMARRKVIVRALPAVEGLGSCTLVASDKTGTLTCNELTLREIYTADGGKWFVSGTGFEPTGEIEPRQPGSKEALKEFLEATVLCNEAELNHQHDQWSWRGDPTDIAFLTAAWKLGVYRNEVVRSYPVAGVIPFEPEQQFAVSFHSTGSGLLAYVKGAPEKVLAMCGAEAGSWRDTAREMARSGYRVLAVAVGPASSADESQTLKDLKFLGLAGMIDPLRPEAKEAVHRCQDAGVRVCMVTGDHPVTALAISRELGLAEDEQDVISGPELERKSPEELEDIVSRVKVFARVTPDQKLKIVEAARRAGHFVAVTGDGVNDAPALRAANIGVAMGRSGTDVAREAASLVLSDDNFATITAGIEEGRVAYDNVRKVIFLLVSTGIAELIVVGLAVFAGMPLPLLPVQLLWLNLVTNGIQDVALAFEPNEGGVMRRRPRSPREPIFNRLMIERALLSASVMAFMGFFVFKWLLDAGWHESAARNALLLLMVLFENIHIGNCRSETKSAFVLSPFKSPVLLCGTLCAFLLHVLAMHFAPLQAVLQTQPVDARTWALLLTAAFSVLVIMEIHKFFWRARFRSV